MKKEEEGIIEMYKSGNIKKKLSLPYVLCMFLKRFKILFDDN